jgi:cytoskeletal protein CcmA (bactofilin family)
VASSDRLSQILKARPEPGFGPAPSDDYNWLVGLLNGDEPADLTGGAPIYRFAAPVRLTTFDGVDNDGANLTDALTGRRAPNMLIRGKHGYHLEIEKSGGGLVARFYDSGVELAGPLSINGNVAISGNFSASGTVGVGTDLSVGGNSTLGDAIGDATLVNGTFRATGAATLDGALSVGGNLAVDGGATLGNAIGDNHTINGAVTVTNDLAIQGELSVDGNVTIGTDNSDRLDVVAQASFTDDVIIGNGTTDRLLVRGGTNGLQLSYDDSVGTGVFTLGATNAADPSMPIKDNSGDTVATFYPSGSTYQFETTGDLHVTDDAYIDGDLCGGKVIAGATAAAGTEELRVVGQSRFEGDVTMPSGTFIHENSGNKRLELGSTGIGFFGAAQDTRQTVTGSRGGNAALQSLLDGLANLGLITDMTT